MQGVQNTRGDSTDWALISAPPWRRGSRASSSYHLRRAGKADPLNEWEETRTRTQNACVVNFQITVIQARNAHNFKKQLVL